MLEQPDSPTASETKKQVFDHYLYRLQSEIHAIIASEQDYEDRVKSLENELSVFKEACLTAENEKRALKERVEKLESQLTITQKTEKRIICLIDGDGTVFAPEIVKQGRDGGRLAAKLLTESVQYHLLPGAPTPCHLWTYVFFNKNGLMDTFARASSVATEFRAAREVFDDFILGFNQACERFAMVDVGSGKEAADAKMKAHLDMHIRSPETFKIIFGGCHDNGYIPQLQSLLTAGLREKLVLLPGYNDMGVDMHKLQLPSLVIPGLFLSEKIILSSKESRAHSHSRQSSYTSTPIPQKNQNQNASQNNNQNAGQNQVTSSASRERSVSDLGPPPGLLPPLPTPPGSDTADSDGESQRGGSPTPLPPPPYHDSHARPHSPSPTQMSPELERTKAISNETSQVGIGRESPNTTRSTAINPTGIEIVNSTSQQLRMTATSAAVPQRIILGNASGPVSYRSSGLPNMGTQSRRLTQSSTEYYPSQYDEQSQQQQMGIANNTNTDGDGSGFKNMSKQRRINRDIALSQHNPPPCTLFYLAANGCKHGVECRFGHDYVLDAEDYELLKNNAKKVPCPAANRGDYCVFGDDCCYGHFCPQLTGCPFFRRGKCKFAGVGMHRET